MPAGVPTGLLGIRATGGLGTRGSVEDELGSRGSIGAGAGPAAAGGEGRSPGVPKIVAIARTSSSIFRCQIVSFTVHFSHESVVTTSCESIRISRRHSPVPGDKYGLGVQEAVGFRVSLTATTSSSAAGVAADVRWVVFTRPKQKLQCDVEMCR